MTSPAFPAPHALHAVEALADRRIAPDLVGRALEVNAPLGRLAIMVGGDSTVLEHVRPYLLAIGPTITHIGARSASR